MKIFVAVVVTVICFITACKNKQQQYINTHIQQQQSFPLKRVEPKKLNRLAINAKKYCKANHLNTNFFYLVDLSLHSGVKRFFVWDFTKDTITNSYMVSHGCYKNSWGRDYSKEKAMVSNDIDSHCSAIGKYIIANRGVSQWGIKVKYNLYGLDSTNSNAFKRQIVLHSWDAVTDKEVFPNGTVEGWGCPALSNNALKTIDEQLKKSSQKVLLWMVN